MIGTLISVVINAFAFFLISKFLPGFRMKNDQTALIVSAGYSFLGFIAGFLIAPLMIAVMIVLALFAFIPIIGPLLAGAGFFATVFLLYFGISIVLLIVLDKLSEDFEMDSTLTAAIAAFLLAAINVGVRALLPGI